MTENIPPTPEAAFQAFLRAHSPEGKCIARELDVGAPVPATWPYGAAAWETYGEAAREHLRTEKLAEFAVAIAVQGFYPDELATGQLRDGAELNLVTGRIKRG